MKCLFVMFVCLCLQKEVPVKEGKKVGTKAKKESKATFNKLAPSILIFND